MKSRRRSAPRAEKGEEVNPRSPNDNLEVAITLLVLMAAVGLGVLIVAFMAFSVWRVLMMIGVCE